MLFKSSEEWVNADCLPPRFKLDHGDAEFFLEPFLFIRGDAINLSLQMDFDTFGIGQAQGRSFGLSIG
jgi:hypothetical protein